MTMVFPRWVFHLEIQCPYVLFLDVFLFGFITCFLLYIVALLTQLMIDEIKFWFMAPVLLVFLTINTFSELRLMWSIMN